MRRRAWLMEEIRNFFAERGVLEVDTPLLQQAVIPETHLEWMVTHCRGVGPLYLQSSPEAAMKRLLAAGVGPIYQICKAFRDGESGRFHNPEFTLLEWYRPHMNHLALMDEVEQLLQRVVGSAAAHRVTYREAFHEQASLDPFDSSLAELRRAVGLWGMQDPDGLDRDACLDLLLSHVVAPRLGTHGPCFLFDFPAEQAALARVRGPVAERFELFLRGIEIANGFHELTDPREQRRRFAAAQSARARAGLTPIPPDEHILEALAYGMPDCAGVALGVDRLLMCALGSEDLADTLTFPMRGGDSA